MNKDRTLEEVGLQFSVTRERISPDRSQGAKEAEAPEPVKDTQKLPRSLMRQGANALIELTSATCGSRIKDRRHRVSGAH
jgi:hypothetical protein